MSGRAPLVAAEARLPLPGSAPEGSPLKNDAFRGLWIGTLASNLGSQVQAVGAAWTMIVLGGSEQQIGLVQTAMSLPVLFLSMAAGAIADNFNRRTIMLAAQAFMLLASATLAILSLAGDLSPRVLLGFTFLIACGAAINAPAWQSSVGDLVARPQLPNAIALNSMAFNIARSVGPALGGAILAAGDAADAFLVNTASCACLIVALLRLPSVEPPRLLPRERIGSAIVAGVRYVAMAPTLLTTVLRVIGFGIFASAVPAMMPLVARDLVGGGAISFGILLAGFGGGAIAGAYFSARLRRRFATETLLRGAMAMVAAGAAGAAIGGGMSFILPAVAVAGAGWVLSMSTFNTSVQVASPRWVVARALGFYQMSAFGGIALGSSAFGFVAERSGVAAALLICATGVVFVLAAGLRWPLPQIASDPIDSADGHWPAPETELPLDWRSGPITVGVIYRVPPATEPAFLALLDELRRVRQRNGARRWSLQRDVAAPERWIERYRFATWLDYVRHNNRRTRSDHLLTERLRDLLPADAIRVERVIDCHPRPFAARDIAASQAADAAVGITP